MILNDMAKVKVSWTQTTLASYYWGYFHNSLTPDCNPLLQYIDYFLILTEAVFILNIYLINFYAVYSHFQHTFVCRHVPCKYICCLTFNIINLSYVKQSSSITSYSI